jgi:hypothetical protein
MRALAIFVFLAGAWVPAKATTLQQLTLREMAEKSTSIVRVKVTGSSARLRGSDVYTVYQLTTLETLKGQASTATSEVAVPGGIAGELRQVVSGAPTLRIGREYVLFLWTSRSGLTQLMGMSQGLFAVERPTPGDVMATRSSADEPMLDSLGHTVRDATLSLPLSELRAKVLAVQVAGRQ